MAMWGIHNDELSAELLEGGFVSVAWDRVGDLRQWGNDQEAIREALRAFYPDAKPGAFPVWAGVMRRFVYTMAPGDYVIAPDKATRTLNFGQITGPYEYVPGAPTHRNRRPVTWLKTGVARSLFPVAALHEIGSALTLFQVKRHEPIFQRFLESPSEADFENWLATASVGAPEVPHPSDVVDESDAVKVASDIEQETQDLVVGILRDDLTHEEFEHFTADLLRAMGYQARVTQYSSDGGVDVIAHRDPLGLEPPIIKVQCKHTSMTMGRPEVQKLLGTLATGELGLFFTLGTYSKEAAAVERGRRDLRLFAGADVTRLTLQHYADLPQRWRDRMPLRRVWVLDRTPDAR